MTTAFNDLLAQRQFMRFWLARIAGITAYQMLMLAISWQMYALSGSAWDLGLVGLYQFVPALMLTLLAGQVADRFNRGHIILACFVAQAVTSAVLWLAAVDGWLHRELLLVLSIVLGAARAFQMPAQQALLPLLVTERLFPRAMAASRSISWTLGNFLNFAIQPSRSSDGSGVSMKKRPNSSHGAMACRQASASGKAYCTSTISVKSGPTCRRAAPAPTPLSCWA